MPGTDVIIVGGGVIGCSIAYHLAQAGARVTVFERGEIGGEASGAACGLLLGPEELLGQGPLASLCLASEPLFPALAETLRQETGIDIEYQRSGLLCVALSDEEAGGLREIVDQAHGLLEWVDPGALRVLEPRLAPARGAFYFPSLHQVNAGHFTQALAQAGEHRGVVLRRGVAVTSLLMNRSHVTGVRSREGRSTAGHVVLAAGPWTTAFGRQFGVPLPVRPVRGQMLAFASSPTRNIVVRGDDSLLIPKPNSFLFVGTAREEVGLRKNTTVKVLADLRKRATALVPSLSYTEVASTWAGLRPFSPDELPILGPVPGWEGVSVASGHSRKGIKLAPITGRLIAQQLTRGKTEIPLKPSFAPDRFAGRPPSAG
jgi:glycine oxidase